MYSSPNYAKGFGIAAAILVVVLGLITLFSAMRFVDTGKIGVVTQYGRVTGRELNEGFAWVAPWGANNVTQYDIKVQKEQAENTMAATLDQQDVTSTVVLNYQLKRGSVSKIHQDIGADFKGKVVEPAILETYKAAAAKYTATQLITNRAEVKADTYAALKERLDKYGITVLDVSITNFKFSDSFSKAIEDKQVAQQNAERAKFNLEAAQTDAQAQQAQSETLSDAYLRKLAIDKWDGKLPTYTGGGSEVMGIPIKQ